MMESQLEKLEFLDLVGASDQEVALLKRLQSVAATGHSKVSLPAEQASSPPAAAPAAEPAAETPPPAQEEDTAVYETRRLPPDGIEFAGEEAASASGSEPAPSILSQSQGLLGDMPTLGPGGLMQPPVQSLPMQSLMPAAGQHQLYHPQQQCPPGYHAFYMNGMMYSGGYPIPGYPPHEPPPEPEPRAGRRGGKHKQEKSMYGAGSGYPMTSRTAAGPPLVMAPYPNHPPFPHLFQMPYPHGIYYPGPLPPEMMMPQMQQQHMDVSMPPPPPPPPTMVAAAPTVTAEQQQVTYARPETNAEPAPAALDSAAAIAPLAGSVASRGVRMTSPSGAPASSIAADASAPASGPVRLSFGFDLDDKLGGEAGDSRAVLLETASPVPAAGSVPADAADWAAGDAEERLGDGRPSSAEPGDTAALLLGAVPASYVATVTVSARVIGRDGELQRCPSPAESQDSGVAHTDLELGSPVTAESTSAPEVRSVSPVQGQGLEQGVSETASASAQGSPAFVQDVQTATQAVSVEVQDRSSGIQARSVTVQTPSDLAAVEAVPINSTAPATSAAAPDAAAPPAASPPPSQSPQPVQDRHREPPAAPSATQPPIEKLAAPEPAAPPAPRSWASLFSKKSEGGGAAPSPAPAPKPAPAPPPPTADSELLSLGAALSSFEPNYKPVALQPRGLTNKSNWCYINAVLQALANCQPFYHLMKSLPANVGLQTTQSRTPIVDAMLEFIGDLRLLQDVPRVSRRERERGQLRDLSLGAPLEPSYVYSMLSRVSNDAFRVAGRQEDAEEFLTCLLSGLQDEMAEVLKVYEKSQEGEKAVNGSTNGKEDSQSDDDDDNWQTIISKNRGQVTRSAELQTTPISRIFSGQLRSALHRQGSKATATVQSFFSLQLDIQSAAVSSVEEALEQLVGRDAVVGLTCPTTGRPVEAWQQAALELVPPTLILHLKRFLYDPASDGVQKLLKRVTYPVDLELKRDLLSAARGKLGPGQKKYRLFAVVYHAGKESTKGHYITDAYHPAYQQWVRYDDSTVTAVSESSVLKPESPLMPYILFYRRLEPHAAAHNGK